MGGPEAVSSKGMEDDRILLKQQQRTTMRKMGMRKASMVSHCSVWQDTWNLAGDDHMGEGMQDRKSNLISFQERVGEFKILRIPPLCMELYLMLILGFSMGGNLIFNYLQTSREHGQIQPSTFEANDSRLTNQLWWPLSNSPLGIRFYYICGN